MKITGASSISSIQLPLQNSLPRMQIKLNRRSVKKVIEFMRQLMSSSIPSQHIYFSKLEHGTWDLARKPDTEMYLEKFTELLEKNKSRVDTFALQIGSPDPVRIRFAACFEDKSKDLRFAELSCIYNSINVEIVNEI